MTGGIVRFLYSGVKAAVPSTDFEVIGLAWGKMRDDMVFEGVRFSEERPVINGDYSLHLGEVASYLARNPDEREWAMPIIREMERLVNGVEHNNF